MSDEALGRIRQLCLALPETTERLSHGAPTWFVRDKKTFVTYMDDHHGDGRLAIWCAAPSGVQSLLVEENPVRFFVPPYVGSKGWVAAWLDHPVDWDQLAGLLLHSYRLIAPKKLLALLDEE